MTIILSIIGGIVGLILLYLLWLVFYSSRVAAAVEKKLPPMGKTMEVNGSTIQYVDRGDGPPIVMVHGLGGHMRHFTYAMQERLDNNYRTIIIDRPGCGYSTRKSDDAAAVTEQAKTIAELIKKLGLEQPLVVGHSLGGIISLALAVNHPECVGGLALIAPLTQPKEADRELPPAFRALNIPSPFLRSFVAHTFAIPAAIKNREQVLADVFGPEEMPEDFPTKGGGMLSLRPRNFYTTSTDFMHSATEVPQISAGYGNLNIPVGIIFGTEDRVLDYKVEALGMEGQTPNLTIELVEGAGHMIPMTKPDETAGFIRNMAAKVGTPNLHVVNN